MADFVPYFSVEEATLEGINIGIKWDQVGFTCDDFQRAMCLERQRALEDPDVAVLDAEDTARLVAKNLFAFPNFYTESDMLEAAYDEYWSERDD